jgi:hypothetical protein
MGLILSSPPRLLRRSFTSGLAAAISGAALGCGGAATAPQPPAAPTPGEPPREAPAPAPRRRAAGIPPRAPDARGGREVFEDVDGLGAGERERRLQAELVAGNVPGFLRSFVAIDLPPAGTRARSATVYVAPDYLCLGGDDDYVRVAVTIRTAKKLAKASGCALPTRKLVDAIYAASHPITSPSMYAGASRPAHVLAHHEVIEGRRAKAGIAIGELIAGCKKDIVVSKRMLSEPGRTPIYGWFLANKEPVQGLSLVHDDRFADYVQGIRLVDRRVVVDGKEIDYLDLLADPELAPLVSDEGAFDLSVVWEKAP